MDSKNVCVAKILVDILMRHAGISKGLAVKLLIWFLKDNEENFHENKEYLLKCLNS